MNLWQLLGNLHPKLVHFPLVLLLTGLLFDAAGFATGSQRCHWAGKTITIAGTISLLFAFVCGIYAEVWAGRAGIPHGQIELHELFANVASWGFVILAAWRLFLRNNARGALFVYLLVGLGWYALMVITAHLGGALVFDYGAAVTGARANSTLSLHDLNTLATRQTDLNLCYSEMMHHIFGYLTLALAGSLFIHALLPGYAGRLKWVGPTLLLAGGVFLFFFADLDLYRLTDLRQWRDREVQLHKTIAIILTVAGAAGLRRGDRRKNVRATLPGGLPISSGPGSAVAAGSDAAGGRQGKMIAVMALIGGGLLFTHVHTVAPYANVAAGVYIAHIVLGSVALLIGATRLLADAMAAHRRPLSVAFAALLCVEAVLLITYNEGLPWYIGYGGYNRWGPHGGTVAPYGSCRAELTFDDASQRLDVYVLNRYTDAPVAVDTSDLNVLIDRGYQQTAVPVRAVTEDAASRAVGNSGHSHFSAPAPFLKGVPAFCARLDLPMGHAADATLAPRMKTSYFDPWVTPVIAAVPPNELARFQCPMHEGIRATAAGNCPLCGMPLTAITSSLRTTLHDPAYDMGFTAACSGASSDDGSRHLLFTPAHNGRLLRELAIVHEHPLHLIIVSADLAFFDHVHPLPQPDGSLALDYRFPAPGQYLLFAEITPRGGRSQVFRFPLTIGKSPGSDPPPELAPSAAFAKPLPQDPSIVAELIPIPRSIVAGPHTQLLVRLTRNGQPLTDLQPYLGAMGHCVILSQDTQTYLHCHPEQLQTPRPGAAGGPDVVFHTHFPHPGRYKVWAQFNRGGTILVADFVVQVEEPILPPRMMELLFDE